MYNHCICEALVPASWAGLFHFGTARAIGQTMPVCLSCVSFLTWCLPHLGHPGGWVGVVSSRDGSSQVWSSLLSCFSFSGCCAVASVMFLLKSGSIRVHACKHAHARDYYMDNPDFDSVPKFWYLVIWAMDV